MKHQRRRLKILVLCLVTLLGWGLYKSSRDSSAEKFIAVEDGLYVTDWSVSKIFGPGTERQQQYVKQFQYMGIEKLEAPILYRIGVQQTAGGEEDILLAPFDPSRPESALALRPTSPK